MIEEVAEDADLHLMNDLDTPTRIGQHPRPGAAMGTQGVATITLCGLTYENARPTGGKGSTLLGTPKLHRTSWGNYGGR